MNTTKLISAAFTPMRDNGSTVNLEKIGIYYKTLKANGVKGTMICGTTGEGYSLSIEERIELAKEWNSVIEDGFELMVHVGHNAIPEIKKLVESFVSLNSSAIVLSPPIFFKPADIDNLIDFLSECIGNRASSNFYYYHIPSMTGVEFPMIQFLNRVQERGINLKGIKYTHEDISEYSDCVKNGDHHFDMIFGRDELLFDALKFGAKSALGSTYNFMAPIFLKLIDSFKKGDMARAAHFNKEINEIIDVLIKFGGGVIAGKSMMQFTGLDLGPVRLPLRNLDAKTIRTMEKQLGKTKFFDYSHQPQITQNN